MDVRAVREAVGAIVAAIRAKPHPHFLEVRTYRYRGHSMSDPATYRSKQEVEAKKADDPITGFRDVLIREGILTEERFTEMQQASRKAASDSVSFADRSPAPPLAELHDYTYRRAQD
jgi:pyruvate dehydrogenase E1 component alpha subunit